MANRKIWLLNLTLVALAGLLGWRLRLAWLAGQTQERAFLSQAPHVRALIAPPPAPLPAPVKPADYDQVAQQMLFSRDRNPNVIVAPPPPPPPPPPMPALPSYYGQMAIFGPPVVLLSVEPNGEQKSYRAGDLVGKFKLVAFDSDSITFDWNGQNVVRKLSEVMGKDTEKPAAPAAAPAPSATFAPPVDAGKTSITAEPPKPTLATKPAAPGNDMGAGFRACVAGDASPAGTVANGYTKKIVTSLMGPQCFWEQNK
ncbi:MAG TPA: hypothetical protein VKV74_13580 [Bryobacteraceae bacterium]|nr:hypothetical protein [Bryobacteraceae bacterium]